MYFDRLDSLKVKVTHPSSVGRTVKPIFHCDAKTFALDLCVGLDPQREILRWEYQHVGISKH